MEVSNVGILDILDYTLAQFYNWQTLSGSFLFINLFTFFLYLLHKSQSMHKPFQYVKYHCD